MAKAIVRIQVDTEAKTSLDEICDRRGMTQIAVMSRLVNWFAKQGSGIQTAVMQSLSEPEMTKLARQLLKQLAK